MRHDHRLSGARFALRPIADADAAFVLSLRTDPQLSRYLHPTSPKVEDQLAWLGAYYARAGDYYFIVEDQKTDEAVGAIGLYDVADGAGEWGRWLIRPGVLAAVESALLIYRFAFEVLGLEAVYCRTVADNASVVSFHDSSGAPRAGVLKDQFELGGRAYDAVEHRVRPADWAAMEPKLAGLAQRIARV